MNKRLPHIGDIVVIEGIKIADKHKKFKVNSKVFMKNGHPEVIIKGKNNAFMLKNIRIVSYAE